MDYAVSNRTFADIPIIEHKVVDSTQITAREWLENNTSKQFEQKSRLICVHCAQDQTKGRGRRDRTWESSENSSLLATFIVRISNSDPITEVARVMLSFQNTIENLGLKTTIKWPNDLILQGSNTRKLAGCLSEIIGSHLLVGVGVNLSKDSYGRELNHIAVSLQEQGLKITPESFLNLVIENYIEIYEKLNRNDTWNQYQKVCSTIGEYVKVQTMTETFSGLAKSVTEEGSLLVETKSGVVALTEGDVVHLRSQE